MVGSKGKGSKSKAKNRALVRAKPEPETGPLKISVEESVDGHVDGEEEKNEISNKEVNLVVEEGMDERISGAVVGIGHEEKEQNVDEVNGEIKMDERMSGAVVGIRHEEKGRIEEVNGEEKTDERISGAIVGIAHEEKNRISEEVDGEEKGDVKEPIEHGLDNDVNIGEERMNTEVAVEDEATIYDGLATLEHGIGDGNMTNKLENVREGNELITEEPMGTPTENSQEESRRDGASASSEVKVVPEMVNRPKRKLIRKKVVKKKMAAEDEVTIDQGLATLEHGLVDENITNNLENEREGSEVKTEEPMGTPTEDGKEESRGADEIASNEVKEVPEMVNRPKRKLMGEKVVKKKMAAEDEATIDQGLATLEHGVVDENITNNLENEREGNEVKTEEPMGTPTEDGTEESRGADESASNEVKEVPEMVNRPKRKLIRKKVVKKKMAAEDEATVDRGLATIEHGLVDENITNNLENEREGNEVKIEEPVGTPIEDGREESRGADESASNEVKEVPEMVNRPKRKLIRKKVVKKKMAAEDEATVDQGLASLEHGLVDENITNNLENEREGNEVKTEEPVGTPTKDGREESRRVDESASNEVKEVPEMVNKPKRKLLRKKVVKKKIVVGEDVAAGNEAKSETPLGNDAPSEECKVDTDKPLKAEEKREVKPSVKVNKKIIRKRKWAAESHSGIAAVNDEQKPKPEKSGNKESKETDEQDVMNKEAANSGDRVIHLKSKGKNKVAKEDTRKVVTVDINKPGPSKKRKFSKKIDDGMGMIFMCNSETKKDCYRYKVFGLPAGKKDVVSKIYNGMRLFLFDIDLKMMYGIYKAAGPGGYNIEPRAFKSQFPSQVRFTVSEDCLPLAEEKFRNVIKDNYYTKNKFNCQLTNEQVKNLCKLFHETSKRAQSKQPVGGSQRIAPDSSSLRRVKKRKRAEDRRRGGPISSSQRDRNPRRPREEARPMHRPLVIEEARPRRRPLVIEEERPRRGPLVIEDRFYQPPVVYEREAYQPSPTPVTLYHTLPAENPPNNTSSYSYRDDIYSRDRRAPLEHRELGSRHPVEPIHGDPYVTYRETRTYREPPVYESGVRREPAVYESDVRREPAVYESGVSRQHYEYPPTAGRRVEYYYTPPSREYRSTLPLYRRY